jgi:hypothetical protein
MRLILTESNVSKNGKKIPQNYDDRPPFNPRGQNHQCIEDTRKTSFRIVVNGQQFNAMRCRYGCGKFVYRDENLTKEPKLLEVDTKKNHNYPRCYNIQIDSGKTPDPNVFKEMSYSLSLDEYPEEDRKQLIYGMTVKHQQYLDNLAEQFIPSQIMIDLYHEDMKKSREMELRLFGKVSETFTQETLKT